MRFEKKHFKGLQGERAGIITLGCARNEVDSEKILQDACASGATIVPVEKASVIFINTCGFTQDAKEESLSVMEDIVARKRSGKVKKVIVCGCLSERYAKELADHFQEVDAFFGIADFKKFSDSSIRVTPKHYAYLKIAEGCVNRCTYCAIPLIKGPLRSRSESLILGEAKSLDARGVRELNIVGQDITLYGLEKKHSGDLPLVVLLKKILAQTQIPWIRLLYLHPKRVTEELIELLESEKRICPYIDLPLQHINDRILKRMNRGIDKKSIILLLDNLRRRIPSLAIRTTFIVGFPSETQEEFQELLDFVKEVCFDRMGAFCYSPEEGTAAYRYRGQVSSVVKKRRYDQLMTVQQKISQEIQFKKIGRIIDVLVDEVENFEQGIYAARTRTDAPDVDGVVFLKTRKKIEIGSVVKCKIIDAQEYDLAGELV